MTQGPINIYEFEAAARERMPKSEYDFVAGGATDEITLQRTRAVFDAIMLRPRMLVDISEMSLATTVQGQHISFPVMGDPSGGHGRAHPDAEVATAKAVGAMGTAMVLSSGSSKTLEEVADAATGPIWFQQYFYSDRGLSVEMAERAKAAGYSVLCVTVDSTVQAKRERNIRNNYTNPPSPNYAHLELDDWQNWEISTDAPRGVSALINRAATWSEVEWLSSTTSMPVVLKGIMTGEDGRMAAESGAKGLIVSNHGARQLDTTFSSVEVLPEVVQAVEGKAEVYLDGGVRRGTDILKALALGARAVLVGRPLFWGLSVDGEAGLTKVLQMLKDELYISMGMCGRPTIESIDASLIGAFSPLISVLSPPEGLRLPQH